MSVAMAVSSIAGEHLPGAGDADVAPVGHGGTSLVFRASRGASVLYVKLAEEPGEDMAVEAHVHDELRRRGVKVPEVVWVEPPHGRLGRGALVLAPVPGRSLLEATDPAPVVREAVAAAGRDLALIGQVPVKGFGFVRRDTGRTLRADHPTAAELLVSPARSAIDRAGHLLGAEPAERARSALAMADSVLAGAGSSVLAHGDYDASHVYIHDGAYAGIIDFGEIRGAPRLYDVAHFAVHAEQAPAATVAALLEGYGAAGGLPAGHEREIALLGTLIALRLLAIAVDRRRDGYAALLTRALDRLTRYPVPAQP